MNFTSFDAWEKELFDKYNGDADDETYDADAYYGRLLDDNYENC